jgi:hypothetical protein
MNVSSQLFQARCLEALNDLILNGIADFKWTAADFTVFHISVMVHREI